MSDLERAGALMRALEETTAVLRDCLWELSSRREVDNEMALIKENEALIGKNIEED